MSIKIQLENIKCAGCASRISKKLLEDSRVSSVEVDVEQGIVEIESAGVALSDFSETLLKMGYPQTGTAEGIEAAKARAKSFVSCAIGRVDNMVNK